MGPFFVMWIFISMKKKLKITESQLTRLKALLVESSKTALMVEKMKKDLDSNYTISNQFMKEGGEYKDAPMIKINVDGELISPKDLYDTMQYKYKNSREFTEQVIRDWFDGKITKNHMLSKNVSLN
jgi:hypothetical protein